MKATKALVNVLLRHILLLLISLLLCMAPAWGAESSDELDLFGEEEVVVSTARSPRPISQIAENVSVITAEQIALLNAHTLADILQTIPGVQLNFVRTPGSFSNVTINGAAPKHILVLVDGITQSMLVEEMADVGLLPAQRIERVEIIKGAASAAWGSALGGVINVITKSPESEKNVAGAGFASYGERGTSDLHGEVSGTVNRFGYYLSGGNLHSKGLALGNRVNFNDAFAKFTYDLPSKGALALALDYRDRFTVLEDSLPGEPYPNGGHDTDDTRKVQGHLSFLQPLTDRLTLEMRAWGGRRDENTKWGDLIPPAFFSDTDLIERIQGGNASLTWRDAAATVVAGVDYQHDEIRQVENFAGRMLIRNFDRWGSYVNGAFTLGRFTLLPGIRLDHTGVAADNVSYTLGATYRLSDKTVLRGYGARGYSRPIVSADHEGLQKVWTAQVGAETAEIPFLLLKTTFFYSDTWDIQDFDYSTTPATAIMKEQVKQGVELEASTVPLLGFSLAGGYTFVDARDRDTKDSLYLIPSQSVKASVKYENSRWGLSGILTGNYVWWNAQPSESGYYKPVVWDLSLTQKLRPSQELSPELFFSAHNLFDGAQYNTQTFKNPGRWLEGGVRFRF